MKANKANDRESAIDRNSANDRNIAIDRNNATDRKIALGSGYTYGHHTET
jgi:hypothetical protein